MLKSRKRVSVAEYREGWPMELILKRFHTIKEAESYIATKPDCEGGFYTINAPESMVNPSRPVKPFPAFFDSAAGLLKVQILEAWQGRPGGYMFKVRVTSRRNRIYPCGAILESNALSIVPRYAISRRKYSTRILAYDWNRHLHELPMKESADG